MHGLDERAVRPVDAHVSIKRPPRNSIGCHSVWRLMDTIFAVVASFAASRLHADVCAIGLDGRFSRDSLMPCRLSPFAGIAIALILYDELVRTS